MLSKRHVIQTGKSIMLFLLLWVLMFQTAGAEMLAEIPPAEQTMQPAVSAAPVEEEGDQLLTGPVLMVTDYSVIEGETVPGSSFVLQMNIANLSEYASAHNVLATLKIENVSVALQEGATNQYFFYEILPMQSMSVQFPLEVYSYCVEENMILSMTMTCYDAAAVHYDFQTMMTPNVDVVRTLYVGSLTVPQFVHSNSSMIVSATLNNIEPVALSNVSMHMVTRYGEQVTQVGQLLSGESKTTNCIYRFPEQQTEEVKIYFTYENLSGHEFSTEPESFEVIVYDPAVEDDFVSSNSLSISEILDHLERDTLVPGTDVQLPIPVIAVIMFGCVGYVVVLYFALRRKRK